MPLLCVPPTPVAQLVERLPYKEDVGGSSPSGRTKRGYCEPAVAAGCATPGGGTGFSAAGIGTHS